MLKRNGERERVDDEEHEKNKLNRNGNGPFTQKKNRKKCEVKGKNGK